MSRKQTLIADAPAPSPIPPSSKEIEIRHRLFQRMESGVLYVQEKVTLQKKYLIYLHQKMRLHHLLTITILKVEYYLFVYRAK